MLPNEISWAPQLKKTRQRVVVLQVMREADRPMTALDIFSALERQGSSLWLSTIYRVLDSFVDHGMLRKAQVLEGGSAVYEINDHKHRHYAVCVACQRIIELSNCPLESFRPQLSEPGFQVLGHRLQMFGLCDACTKQKRC